MKIKKFLIEPKVREIITKLKKMGVKNSEGVVAEEIENLKNIIEPAVVFESYTNNLKNSFPKYIDTNDIIGITFLAGTIGEKIDDEIEFEQDESRKKIKIAIVTEYCQRIPDFVRSIIEEEINDKNVYLKDFEEVSEKKDILKMLEAEKINIRISENGISPKYSVIGCIKWLIKRRKNGRRYPFTGFQRDNE